MNCSNNPHRHRLWQAWTGLAQAVVRDYVFNQEHVEDAHQEVMMALWEATASWQADIHSSFDRYAFYVMRGKLFRYLTEKAEDRPTLSRKERDVLKTLRSVMKAGQMVSSGLMAELAIESGIGMFRLQQIVSYWYRGHFSITACAIQATKEPSLELEDYLLDSQKEDSLSEALAKLSERERLIIAARFLEDPRQTLAKLALTLGISIERVRVLEGKSLKKLREMLREQPAH
jgi:RNA polymerase sigma factor (sigma-70 family)